MVSFFSDRVLAAALFGAAALGLSGCQPDTPTDKSPPDYTIAQPKTPQGKWQFGVLDTIVVSFSEKIDTGALAVSFEPAQGISTSFKGQDRLLIYGDKKNSGASQFTARSPFTATFAGLKDLRGNGRSAASESFEPYWWSDRDFTEGSFNGFDSLFATDSTWANGRPFTDTLISEGNLDANNNFGSVDFVDIKLIKLVPPDTFRVLLTGPKTVNLKLQIAGPFDPAKADSILKDKDYTFPGAKTDSTQAKGTASLMVPADYGNHDDVLGSPSKPGIYALRITLPLDKEAFYRLQTILQRKKR